MPADTTEKQPGAETDAGRHNRHWPQGRKGAEMHKTETKTEAAKPAQTAPAVHLCPSCRIDHDDYTPDASGEYARVCGVCGWKHGKPETKTETPARLIGYYNRDGYRIEKVMPDDHGNSRTLYEAGNNPLESSNSIVDRAGGLPLRTIRRFCRQTGREIATERGAEFVGVEREEDREDAD